MKSVWINPKTNCEQVFENDTPNSLKAFIQAGFCTDKPLFTQSGAPVIILSTNGPDDHPVIGLVLHKGKTKFTLHRWDIRGFSYTTQNPWLQSNLMPNNVRPFNWAQLFKLRSGEAFRIVGHDRQGERHHYGFVMKNGREHLVMWYDNGRCSKAGEKPYDLVNL